MNAIKTKRALFAWAAFWVLGIATVQTLHAETRVAGTTVPFSATVVGVNSLTTQLKLVSTNVNQSSATFPIITGTQSTWSVLAQQYVETRVSDNALAWELRVYSNNFPTTVPSTTTWGRQYGGLIGNVSGAKVPMAWLVNPNPIGNPGPATGNPVNSIANGWTFLKDTRDVDDPSTPIVVSPPSGDESFAASDDAGFTNIAFGSPNFTRIVRPNAGGSEALATTTSPFFVYFEGDFASSPAASYSTNLVLELINN